MPYRYLFNAFRYGPFISVAPPSVAKLAVSIRNELAIDTRLSRWPEIWNTWILEFAPVKRNYVPVLRGPLRDDKCGCHHWDIRSMAIFYMSAQLYAERSFLCSRTLSQLGEPRSHSAHYVAGSNEVRETYVRNCTNYLPIPQDALLEQIFDLSPTSRTPESNTPVSIDLRLRPPRTLNYLHTAVTANSLCKSTIHCRIKSPLVSS